MYCRHQRQKIKNSESTCRHYGCKELKNVKNEIFRRGRKSHFSNNMTLTILHVSAWFQKLAPSSRLNRTPPTGAPKAADTPAAAPAETKSRFSWSVRKYSNNCQRVRKPLIRFLCKAHRTPHLLCWVTHYRHSHRTCASTLVLSNGQDPPYQMLMTCSFLSSPYPAVSAESSRSALWYPSSNHGTRVNHGTFLQQHKHRVHCLEMEWNCATAAVISLRKILCNINGVLKESGLTLPMARPPTTDMMTPTTLQNNVLMRTTCGILTPLRKHLICGMPLPAATGYSKANHHHQDRQGKGKGTYLSAISACTSSNTNSIAYTKYELDLDKKLVTLKCKLVKTDPVKCHFQVNKY